MHTSDVLNLKGDKLTVKIKPTKKPENDIIINDVKDYDYLNDNNYIIVIQNNSKKHMYNLQKLFGFEIIYSQSEQEDA